MYKIRKIFIVGMVGVFISSGCGGGGGGGNEVGSSSGSSSLTPVVETLNLSAEVGGPYNMPTEITAATLDGALYISTPVSLVQAYKDTGVVKPLAGYNNDPDYNVNSPRNLIHFSDNLYAGDRSGKLFGVHTAPDNFEAIELLYNGHLPGALNTYLIFGNSTHFIYMADDGLYLFTYGNYKNPQFLTPYPPGTVRIIVTEKEVFLGALQSGERSIYRLDLTSLEMQVIQTGIVGYPGDTNPPRMAWNAPYLYWANGSSIERYNAETFGIEKVADTVGNYIENLAADDDFVYAYENYGSPPQLIKVDLYTGLSTVIGNSLLTRAITVENGDLYYLGDLSLSLYKVSGNNPPEMLLSNAEMNLGPWGGYGAAGLKSEDGMLFINSGEKILVYDVTNGQTQVVDTSSPDSFFYQNKSLYIYTHVGSGQLIRVPLDKPLRPLVLISPPRAESGIVQSATWDQGYFYWIWKSNVGSDHVLSRIPDDGSAVTEDLFYSNSELRDVAVHSGRIYFSCLDDCGSQGWTLASLPVDGGAVNPELGLGGDPKTFYENGTLYLSDTFNYTDRSIYALNLDAFLYEEILSDLYYDSDATDSIIKASSKWLYVGQYRASSTGPAQKKLSRYSIIDWNQIGDEEIISNTISTDMMISTLATDGLYLYYWDNGIKRVKE